ncbi:MAG: protein kinase [Rhodothermales bacterium]
MDSSDWTRLEQVFEKALALEGQEQASYLDQACAGDDAMRAELDGMLKAYEAAPGYFDSMRRHVPGQQGPTRPSAPAALRHGVLQPGERVNQYEIERELGAGGMGVVYLARDTRLNRLAALKFLPTIRRGDQELSRRFLQEAQAASLLDHPNICTIFEFNETEEGIHFIAMGYYEGETLKARMKRDLPYPEAIDFARQMLRGLAHAHEHGIVHRDIKPDNLFLTAVGAVKILDFGLAKMQGVDLTRTGMTMGTVAYMCPEQARGGSVDHRSDIWSAGVVLYEMVAGARPFAGDYDQAVIYSILNEDPEPPSAHRPDLPAGLDAIVLRCLEKEPDRRFARAQDVLDALDALDRGEPAAPPLSTAERPAAPPTRRLRVTPLQGAAVLLLAALVGIGFWLWARPARPALGSDEVRLAVLPFSAVGVDSALVNGLAYTITGKLTLMERYRGRLAVVSPSEVQAERVRSASAAAERLNANLVLSGSVQQRGRGIQLVLQFIDTGTNAIVNSRVIDVAPEQMGGLEERIVENLAELLDVKLNMETTQFLTAGFSSDAEAYRDYTRARGYLQAYEDETNLDAAISLFGLALKEDSGFVLAYAGLAEAYVLKYELDKNSAWMDRAVSLGRQAVAHDDDLGAVRLTMGMIYLNTGDYTEAERQFLRAYVLDGENVEAQYQLGRVYRSMAEYDKAEEFYLKAIERRPDNWQYYLALGNLYHEMGRHADAIPMYQHVIDLRPTNPWGYNNMAVQYQRLGRLDEAVPLYEKAAEVNPNAVSARALALNNLGGIAYTRDAFAEAAAYYERSVALQNAQLDSWDQLGNAYHWLGEPERARRAWDSTEALTRRRLEINPLDEGALRSGLEAAAKRGDRAAMGGYIARIEAMKPVSGELLVSIGIAYEIVGRRADALRYLRQGFEAGYDPDRLEASAWMDELRAAPAYGDLIAGLSAPPG